MTTQYLNAHGQALTGLTTDKPSSSSGSGPKLGRYDVPDAQGQGTGRLLRADTAKLLTSDTTPIESPYKNSSSPVYYNYENRKGTAGTEHEPTYHTVTADFHPPPPFPPPGHEYYDDVASPGDRSKKPAPDSNNNNSIQIKHTYANPSSETAYEQPQQHGHYEDMSEKTLAFADEAKATPAEESDVSAKHKALMQEDSHDSAQYDAIRDTPNLPSPDAKKTSRRKSLNSWKLI